MNPNGIQVAHLNFIAIRVGSCHLAKLMLHVWHNAFVYILHVTTNCTKPSIFLAATHACVTCTCLQVMRMWEGRATLHRITYCFRQVRFGGMLTNFCSAKAPMVQHLSRLYCTCMKMRQRAMEFACLPACPLARLPLLACLSARPLARPRCLPACLLHLCTVLS